MVVRYTLQIDLAAVGLNSVPLQAKPHAGAAHVHIALQVCIEIFPEVARVIYLWMANPKLHR